MRKLALVFCLVSLRTSHAQLLAELLWGRVPQCGYNAVEHCEASVLTSLLRLSVSADDRKAGGRRAG